MKKILYILSSLILINAITFAQDNMSNEAINAMPSDAEIMQTLEKFNFTTEQKEQLFKETKRRLEQMYSTNDFNALNEAMTQTQNMQEINNGSDLEVEKPMRKKRVKKYTNHPPLTRRSRLQEEN